MVRSPARNGPPRIALLGERLLVRAIRTGARLLRGSFTAGCVCVVRDPAGRILLVKPRYRLDWGLPGGFLKRGEQPSETIRRELREEIGTDLELEEPVLSYVQGRQRHIEYVFEIGLDPGQAAGVAATSPELGAIAWYRSGALPRLQPEAFEALERLAAAPRGASGRLALQQAVPVQGGAPGVQNAKRMAKKPP